MEGTNSQFKSEQISARERQRGGRGWGWVGLGGVGWGWVGLGGVGWGWVGLGKHKVMIFPS